MKIVIYDLEPEEIGKMNFLEGEYELISAADKALYCQGAVMALFHRESSGY